jgi:hypothetical protein
MSTGPEYTFDASVLGLGGYYERNGEQKLVPSIASVVLAPTGGEGWSSATNYDDGDIAFTHAESRVRGYKTSDGYFTTISDIYITNLRMFDRVRIALMQATVTSTRNLGNLDLDESEFQLQALYRGIDVEGAEVVPAVDVEVCHATYSNLWERANDELRPLLAAMPEPAPPLPRLLKDGESVRSTIVHDLKHNAQPEALVKPRKNVLLVPGFAKLKFGELIAKRGRRRVNLLTFDFNTLALEMEMAERERAADGRTVAAVRALRDGDTGSSSGSVTIASVGGNGDPIWPDR